MKYVQFILGTSEKLHIQKKIQISNIYKISREMSYLTGKKQEFAKEDIIYYYHFLVEIHSAILNYLCSVLKGEPFKMGKQTKLKLVLL